MMIFRRKVGNYAVWLEINFIRNYLPDLRITEIVLSGEPEANFDALINNTSLVIQNTQEQVKYIGKDGGGDFSRKK